MKKLVWFAVLLIGFVFVQISCTDTREKESVNNTGISLDTMKIATEVLQGFVDNKKLAGISALVNLEGETVYRENFGYGQLNNKTPMDDDAIFRIFSMTKPITAVALMTLFDEGKFQLDDKVAKYIPEFGATMVYNPETKTLEAQKVEMTIRHLLTHTSGLTYGLDQNSYVDSLYREMGSSAWDGVLADKMKMLAKLPLKFQPGTRWEYGLSIDVAGYLAEVLSGMPLDKLMKERIFDPLKMEDTGFYVPEDKHFRFTSLNTMKKGILKESEGFMAEGFKSPVTLFSGGGGLVSTIDDYLNFCKMLNNGGELNGARILEESTCKLVLTNQMPEGLFYARTMGYGLAGSVNPETGEYGWAGAASTKFWINPNQNTIVIFYTQLMPAIYAYADKFKEIADSALK
jgi:CubicO group peptidase (beta-lactamase class C family)